MTLGMFLLAFVKKELHTHNAPNPKKNNNNNNNNNKKHNTAAAYPGPVSFWKLQVHWRRDNLNNRLTWRVFLSRELASDKIQERQISYGQLSDQLSRNRNIPSTVFIVHR